MAIGRQNQRTQMFGDRMQAEQPLTDLTDRAGMGSSLLGTLARVAELGEENAKRMKKGGKVKKKTKHHRGDGIAIKGKTKGRFV
jgi:hypothetical protein